MGLFGGFLSQSPKPVTAAPSAGLDARILQIGAELLAAMGKNPGGFGGSVPSHNKDGSLALIGMGWVGSSSFASVSSA